ncbi:hypothetical protein Tco_0616816, partial [Tanacetum coccineum]
MPDLAGNKKQPMVRRLSQISWDYVPYVRHLTHTLG